MMSFNLMTPQTTDFFLYRMACMEFILRCWLLFAFFDSCFRDFNPQTLSRGRIYVRYPDTYITSQVPYVHSVRYIDLRELILAFKS